MTSTLLSPFRLGPLEVRNRVIKSATFEGMTDGALVTDELIDFHRRPAAGGVGITTVAYIAASSEGRTYRNQLYIRDEAVPGLQKLTEAVHAEGALVAAQLGHAGWFANPHATKEPNLGPSRLFSPYAMTFSKSLTQADLDRLLRDFERAGRVLVQAGFDAIEVHVGHGYLLSQFLSPYTNRRHDTYGGSIENRARFPRQAVEAVREGAGSGVAVWVKLNMDDGFDGGLTLDEGVEVARMFDADGAIDAIEPTVGFTARTPMYLMRGRPPLAEMVELEKDPVRRLGMRVFAKRLMAELPFVEGYLLPKSRMIRNAVDVPVIYLGGVASLATAEGVIDEGFAAVAMARALLIEPDLVNRASAGDWHTSACTQCNACVTEMDRDGTRCVLI